MNYNTKQKIKNASMIIVLLSLVLQLFVPFFNVHATVSLYFRNIHVEKEWIGSSEDSVTIHLYRDYNTHYGERTETEHLGTAVLNEGNDWKHDFGRYPNESYRSGDYTYRIEEEPIDGYTVQIDGSFDDEGFIIKNIKEDLVTEVTEVTANKIWENAPEVKPTIELQLYRNGEI